MNTSTPDFSLKVDGVEGVCPAGEKHALENIAEGKIPVFSCEGPCIRGKIARLAANIVAKEVPLRPQLLRGNVPGSPFVNGALGKGCR